MSGWVKLHRSLLEWEWYRDINVCRLFIHLLLTANFEEKKVKGQNIERGVLLTTWPELCQATGLSIQQARTAMGKLKSTGEITVKITGKQQAVTVVNYSAYQNDDREDNRMDNREDNSLATGWQQDGGDTFKRIQENNIYNIYNHQPELFDETENPVDENPSAAGEYVFKGTVIRLTAPHFEQWLHAYPHVDLEKELRNRDGWLATQPVESQKNWFISTSNFLNGLEKKKTARQNGRSEVYEAYRKLGIEYSGDK